MGAGLPLRVFLALLVASIPLALGVLVAIRVMPADADSADLGVIFGALAFGSIAWLALSAVLYSRAVREELASVLKLAERGADRPAADETGSGPDAMHRRIQSTLEERNRQVADLATQVSRAPIGEEPRLVAVHVVQTAQSVTRDPTWVLAVLGSSMPDLLPAGVYEAIDAPPSPLGDLHRWAMVGAAERYPERASRLEGPWGAFVAISMASDDDLRAILLAPWEGRVEPSSAEVALLSLIGEHAATAIEHAILYARVGSQAAAIDRMAAVQRDFLRAVTHDLQTPLTSIRAVASEIRAQPGLDEQAIRDLDLIDHQADRLRRMVAQILVVSRLEAGVVEPQLEVVNPRTMVDRTWSALRVQDRSLEVVTSGPSQLAVADPDRLEQVLWALMDNAVKYSPNGEAVRVDIGADGDRAVIAITDQGMGMDSRTAESAFQQFFRAPEARRMAPDGSGIGLYAARGLVELMGGEISLTSRLGYGTTVTIVLPAEMAEIETGAGGSPAPV